MAFSVPIAFASLLGSRAIVQVSDLALLVFAARLLSPAEVGVFALASAVSLFMQHIAQAGWRQYVLAWTDTPDPPPTVFWSAVAAGVAGAAAGMLIATVDIAWFESGDFGWLLLIFSALIPFGSVTTIEFGILNRRGRLGTIAGVNSVAAVLALVGGFAALLLGAGVYALALSRVLRTATSIVLSCGIARWIPRPEIDFRLIPKILAFTSRITAAQLLHFGYAYGAEFVIAAFLGVAEVGIYRLGSRICGSVAELIGEPLRVLSWSIFRHARTPGSGPSPIAETGQTFVLFSMMFAVPALLGLAVTAPNVVDVLVGARWAETASVIGLLALARVLLLPDVFSESLLSLSGSVHLLPKLIACGMIASMVSLLLLAPFGLIAAAVSQLLAAAVFLPIVLYVEHVYGGLDWRRIGWRLLPALAASTAMAAFAHAMGSVADAAASPAWATLSFQVVSSVAVYALTAYCLYPSIRTVLRDQLRGLA
jgi:O-antigen/teichoic acid export membrane protein